MARMSVTIHEVLGDSGGWHSTTWIGGDKSDRAVLSFFKTDPAWVNRFSDVWLVSGRESRRRGDAGIDQVARFPRPRGSRGDPVGVLAPRPAAAPPPARTTWHGLGAVVRRRN